jgi:hypothetical protein
MRRARETTEDREIKRLKEVIKDIREIASANAPNFDQMPERLDNIYNIADGVLWPR